MALTNKLNLPDAIVRAVANDDYSRGASDISVTEMLKPPLMRALEIRHAHEIVEDASDRIWSLIGQVAHGILERSETIAVAEPRLSMEARGWILSGRMDRVSIGPEAVLDDYKVTSVWSLVLEGMKPKREWVEQMNAYAVLLRQNGYAVAQARIIAMLRDWSKLEARRRPRDYPQSQVVVMDVPLWPEAEALAFVKGRVAVHQEAARLIEAGQLNHLVEALGCTAEDRWAKPTRWALMKEGRKSALRICDTESDALRWAFDNGFATIEGEGADERFELKKSITIVKRPGTSTRCESYCAAAPFCPQFAAMKAQGDVAAEADQEEAA